MTTFTHYISESRGELDALRDELILTYGVELGMSIGNNNTISLDKIIVPKEKRNESIGTMVMTEITRYADKNKMIIQLTPTTDFGGKIGKLKSFYKKYGFVENKGKNKDFEIYESFYRLPK